MATRKTSRAGEETKNKILDAALETVRLEGLINTSARAIARVGDFNQALVFYHFGSVEELLLSALERANVRRMARFEERLKDVEDLAGLVRIASELHAGDDDPDASALAAIAGGWAANSDFGPRVIATLEPWNVLVADALRRIMADWPIGPFIPVDDFAYAMAALFLGIETMSRLEGNDDRATRLFAALEGLSRLSAPFVDQLGAQFTVDPG